MVKSLKKFLSLTFSPKNFLFQPQIHQLKCSIKPSISVTVDAFHFRPHPPTKHLTFWPAIKIMTDNILMNFLLLCLALPFYVTQNETKNSNNKNGMSFHYWTMKMNGMKLRVTKTNANFIIFKGIHKVMKRREWKTEISDFFQLN